MECYTNASSLGKSGHDETVNLVLLNITDYVVSPYGFEDTNVLSVEMTLVEDTVNIFAVTLSSDDTIGLDEGTYTVKIVLSDGTNYFKKARGVLNILKDSDTVEV